ncbi:inter-alpha-trypsin inhibitor heavy chain H4 [Puma concolor]|uniref:Inter-alpha-trypsin inhibitor heavy chain H4 n=1 Tax=Puma concolor TaxID=9696 RepID=A0A6P6H877_PUMCO|nr:inter-alpha-trypsin inhibitor heavy chain H4 [Puma concolor]
MKTSAPGRACGIATVLLSLLAVLHTSTPQKNDIDIYSLTVDSRVSSRFAHTVVTSRVVNKANVVQEATFQVELPKRAFITNFSMIIDGVTYPGNIKEKAAAQEQYSTAVARGESAGLIKATGRKMEQFQVSVNVAPSAKVTFELVYEELLKRRLEVYELLLKVQPQQLVKHLQMDIHIFEPQGISFLETESTFMTNELADALTISRNKTKAHIRFKPTLSQQKSPGQEDTVLNGNFIIRYDVNRTLSGGSIQHMQNITFQTEIRVAEKEEEFRSPKYIFHSFMERLWAYLTIQQLLEKMILASDAEKQALETRALNLSLQYSFVTPLTSMVVTKPEGEERSEVAEKPVETENKRKYFHLGLPLSRFHTMGDRRSRLTGSSYADSFLTERSSYRGPTGPSGKAPGNPGRIGPQGPVHSPSHHLTYHGVRDLLLPDMLLAPSTPDEVDLRIKARVPAIPSDTMTHRHQERKPSGSSADTSQPAKTDSPPAPIQAPPVILTLPGQSVNPLCVDIKHSQGPMNLLSDPDQGVEVTGQYETEKAQFSWIEVTFKNPQLQVRASPEHVVVTRNRRNSAYKWKEMLFSVTPGLNMTMDKAGLLLLSSPDKVTIGLLPWDGPGEGLRLLLRDTDRFSSHVGGTLGQFYQGVLWGPPAAADDSRRTLSVQGRDYSATRLLKLDYQEASPGTEISCWSVEL